MRCSILNLQYPRWVFIIIFFFTVSSLFRVSFSDSRSTEAKLDCGNSTTPRGGSNFTSGFVREMENLNVFINSQKWGTSTVNSTPPIYGLAQCFDDLSSTDCVLCYATIRTRIPRCLPSTSAAIYLDGCFLRYETFPFYNQSIDPVRDFVNCTPTVQSISGNSTELGFAGIVDRAIKNATGTAVSSAGGGFGVAEVKGAVETVYALAQCWKTLSREGCRDCLEKAGNETAKGCVPKKEGRGLNAGCYLRYSTVKFYDNEGGNSSKGKLSKGVIIAIVLLAAAFSMLSLCAAYVAYIKLSKKKKDRRKLRQISKAFRKSGFYFKYETLERATDYFDPSRKLGQGGAGSVYMGILSDGRTVAVKRLIFNTRQWVDEFFNEVNLIGGIQHKNLVKLLGCSIEGPESLLVYEYVPKKSIDDFMSDKGMLQTLNWKRRLHIIVGTAEGLAYLHGGAHIRIIHRDIKGSNVLLDGNLDPKIADFGLARCFGPDKTHLSTGVAGTLGYMAPEYLVRGQLTEKADVYSFGVVVLEIVCGRKNNALVQGSSSLLRTVWNLYKSNNLPGAIDPSMGGDFPVDEASNVLRIGLLCAQASAALRPSMAEIVQMLTCNGYEIPVPSQPPFLNANVLDPSYSMRSSSSSSSMLITPTKIEGCTISTESSGTSDLKSLWGEAQVSIISDLNNSKIPYISVDRG